MIQQAVLEELRAGVNVLQQPDNHIVREATEAVGGISNQLQDMIKKQISHTNTLLNHKKALVTLQDDIKVWRNAHQSLENNVENIDKYVRRLPTKADLDRHSKALDVVLQKIQKLVLVLQHIWNIISCPKVPPIDLDQYKKGQAELRERHNGPALWMMKSMSHHR